MRMMVRAQMKMMMKTLQRCDLLKLIFFTFSLIFILYDILILVFLCRVLNAIIGQQKHP